MRLAKRGLLVIVTLVTSTACKESDADLASRKALASLVQRSQSLTAEIAAADSAHRNETWVEVFQRFDSYVEEKEAIRKDMRSVVPTQKFTCLASVLARSLADDIEVLRDRRKVLGLQSLFKQAHVRAVDYFNRVQRNGGETLSGDAFVSAETAAFNDKLALEHTADSASERALERADTLRFLASRLGLLARYPVPEYGLVADTVRYQDVVAALEAAAIIQPPHLKRGRDLKAAACDS